MTNSADRLHDFFKTENWLQRRDIDVFSIFFALEDVKRTLHAWNALGEDVTMYEDALPRWRQAISTNLDGEGKWNGGEIYAPTPGDIGLLRALSQKMDRVAPDYDDKTREKVNDLVDKVTALLVEDSSLPEVLRWHIAKLLLHVRTCLDEFAIRGDLDLDDAVERLIGSMRIAEEKSANGKAWEDVWVNYGRPILLGMFIELTAGGGLITLLSLTAGS